MRHLIPLLLAGLASLPAEGAPLTISAGVAYRYDSEPRRLTDENGDFSWTEDYGYHVRLGTGAPEPGFIGWGSADISWSRNTGNDVRIDTVGILYIERIPLGPVRVGAGVGSYYTDISDPDGRTKKWTIGGGATVSLDIFQSIYLEVGYDKVNLFGDEIRGLKPDAVYLDLGYRF